MPDVDESEVPSDELQFLDETPQEQQPVRQSEVDDGSDD